MTRFFRRFTGGHRIPRPVADGATRCYAGFFVLRSGLLLLAMLAAGTAAADVFANVKVGSMNVNGISSTNPINLAVDLGYELDSDFADMSVVAEINRTVDSGKIKGDGELEFESNGLYLVFRTTRSLFATFSIGAVHNKVIAGGATSTKNGIALGGSIGMVIGRTRFQIEYTSLAGDANFFSLGLGLAF
jgi:hypothetical protein